MDLISSALVVAIAHGAPARVPRPVAERYAQLKSAIARFPNAEQILAIVAEMEAEGGRQQQEPLRLALARALSVAKVPDDMATLFAAQALLDLLERTTDAASADSAAASEASAAPQMQATGEADQAGVVSNYAVVRTYFATDRRREIGQPPAQRFSSARSGDVAGPVISYGVCDISIPRDHRMGQLESPSLWRLELRENPARHVVLLTAEVQQRDQFFSSLAATIAASKRRSAFVFVPGYNVTFEDAARRTGQMAYDLGFDGAPVFYSWPSQGELADYTVDENNIDWSTPHLTAFLADFLQKTDAACIYLIAHSIGSRGLARAVAELHATEPALAQKITEIILTAPDIDADVFRHDIAPRLRSSGRPLTLYASSEDLALAASKAVHGHARAGDSGAGMLILPGMETVDATGVDTGFVKHAYFAEQRSTLSDIYYLIHNNARADQRFLDAVDGPGGRYWTFRR
ncbi:alpha/beta hydrolase [Janthinobacterium aquaticum]|uniref:alpha/beta hydrolase n=1 Tax=Janthinobacterium sp. FT58W TaxID=2654254 RepID=UPI00126584E1|nr:alpha/beta hydrolase [Janthinobacterium sp. FT58W]KAB8041555.1 alpha/beta hydrolase [Janthinobacterium sp. FT58W]